MQNYTNRFSIAVNKNKSELMLNFYQESPNFDINTLDEGKKNILPSTVDLVANLVMSYSCAEDLIHALQKIISDDNPCENEKEQ